MFADNEGDFDSKKQDATEYHISPENIEFLNNLEWTDEDKAFFEAKDEALKKYI